MANTTGQGGNAGGFSIEDAHVFNAAGGANWTPAAIPTGKTLTGVSYSVLTYAADNSVTDSDGTVVTGLPAGYSSSWGTLGGGAINAPQVINAGTGGRIVVTFQVK